MTLVELVEATSRLLREAGLPHAFGGALALGYHAAPRATVDIDVNVFVPLARSAEVVDAFGSLGLRPESPPEEWNPAAGVRLVQDAGGVFVDLFFSLDDTYEQILGRCVVRPFGPRRTELSVLSAEDLIVFKLSFGRPKDWVDLDQLAREVPDVDVELVEGTLLALRGPTVHPRLARFRTMLEAHAR